MPLAFYLWDNLEKTGKFYLWQTVAKMKITIVISFFLVGEGSKVGQTQKEEKPLDWDQKEYVLISVFWSSSEFQLNVEAGFL